MNRAQAIVSLGHGCFSWREDLPLTRSAFVLEVRRCYKALCRPRDMTPRQRSMQRTQELAAEALTILRACGKRMDVGQLCKRLGIKDPNHSSESRMLRRVLDRLYSSHAVHANGTYPRLYWVE